MQYANQHMQQYPLPGAPQEAELVGSGVATESRVMELEEQLERQRLQQVELIGRIAEQEQQTLINQREQLRRMDNGQEPSRSYNPHGARESYRQRHRSREPSVESRVTAREPSRERSERSSGSMRQQNSRETSPSGRGDRASKKHEASFKSRSSDRTDDVEAPAPPAGPGASKRMSVAEQELQMTEEVVNPEGQTTLAQLGPAQIAIRMAMAVFVAGAIGLAIFTILGRLS